MFRRSSPYGKMAVPAKKPKTQIRGKGRGEKEDGSSLTIRFGIVAAAIAVVFAVTWVTYLAATTTVTRIEVEGSHHASEKEVIQLSGVEVGDTLFAIDPEVIEDRIEHHRWIETVEVTRWPTGTLNIFIDEREPVLLAVDGIGRPRYFIDWEGVILPVDTLSRYDVPLLRGLDVTPGKSVRIEDHDALELLDVLARDETPSEDLISDVVLVGGSGLEIVTVPFRDGTCVRVKLGRGDYERKLETLVAFWEQAVVGRSNTGLEWIDLRFDGQVVTKET